MAAPTKLQTKVQRTREVRTTTITRPKDAEKFESRGTHASTAFTINRPAAELFQFWRNFENLPRFMKHLESVRVIDNTHSHWKVKGPLGKELEWDAVIINEEPNRLIAWRSMEGADVQNAGSVRFNETGDRGTEVRVDIEYIPPAGKLGAMIAKVMGDDPEHLAREDLRRFKQLMEAGEIANSGGGTRGTCKHTAEAKNNGDNEGGAR